MRTFAIVFILLIIYVDICASVPILASMYYGSSSAGGVNLSKYPIKRVTLMSGKTVNLFPIAVLPGDVQKTKYRVLEIRHGKKKVYGHIVDTCGDGDCWVNKWKAKKMGRMLVDIHETAWAPLGLKEFSLHKLRAKWTRTRVDRKSKVIKQVLTSDGRHGYVPTGWK